MCQPQSAGGQRCSSHTRAALDRATTHLNATPPGAPGRPAAEARWDTAAVEHASTPTGHTDIHRLIAAAEINLDTHRAAYLRTILRRGQDIRDANRYTAALLAVTA